MLAQPDAWVLHFQVRQCHLRKISNEMHRVVTKPSSNSISNSLDGGESGQLAE